MRSQRFSRRISFTEFLLVLLVTGVLMLLLQPIAGAQDENDPTTICFSHLRQLTVAMQMFAQDHGGQFPGLDWPAAISPYLRGHTELLRCPADAAESIETPISYAYNGLLIQADGTGVSWRQFSAPDRVGMLCDASPTRSMPNGGIIFGAGLQTPADCWAQPAARHDGKVVMGYTDGHAEILPKGQGDRDTADPLTRAFVSATALNYLDNPAGGLSSFTAAATCPDSIVIGGDYCTRPILQAAAEAWRVKAGAPFMNANFTGERNTAGRGADFLWGYAGGEVPAYGLVPGNPNDMVMIVAKDCRIPKSLIGKKVEGRLVIDRAIIRRLFGIGRQFGEFQTYTYPDGALPDFFCRQFGTNTAPLVISPGAIPVKDCFEMIDRISEDPLGIGYCPAIYANPGIVEVVGVRDAQGAICLSFHGQFAGVAPPVERRMQALPIARDALVLIVSRDCNIPAPYLTGMAEGTPVIDYANVIRIFSTGTGDEFHAYSYNEQSGNRAFLCRCFSVPDRSLQIGERTLSVGNDFEMVKRIADDPLGIGYCSAAFADPERVLILGLRWADGKDYFFPNVDPKSRWVYPEEPSWPLMRTLYVLAGGKAWQPETKSGIANNMLAPGMPGTVAIQMGPLFKTGYYPPK